MSERGRWTLYRDTYINGVNASGALLRVTLDVRINGGPERRWQYDAPARTPWELPLASLLRPTETVGMFKATGILECSAPAPDGGWQPAPCDAHVAIWHEPITYAVASTIYNVPFRCVTP